MIQASDLSRLIIRFLLDISHKIKYQNAFMYSSSVSFLNSIMLPNVVTSEIQSVLALLQPSDKEDDLSTIIHVKASVVQAVVAWVG